MLTLLFGIAFFQFINVDLEKLSQATLLQSALWIFLIITHSLPIIKKHLLIAYEEKLLILNFYGARNRIAYKDIERIDKKGSGSVTILYSNKKATIWSMTVKKEDREKLAVFLEDLAKEKKITLTQSET